MYVSVLLLITLQIRNGLGCVNSRAWMPEYRPAYVTLRNKCSLRVLRNNAIITNNNVYAISRDGYSDG